MRLVPSPLLLLLEAGAVLAGSQVRGLPGIQDDQLCFRHFSGYLPTKDQKQLFYWYHEAVRTPNEKPVVLWLNGGPGCSSLGGMFTELGPFVIDQNYNISLNPFSWNKVANILFLEQPAGVGFSYPNTPADDQTTANGTADALFEFFNLHPELKGRPFYIAGESYGGHYVPNAVRAVQLANAALPTESTPINLKGFMVGNGYTDWQLDFNENVRNGRFHALTSQSRFDAANEACDGDFARCFWPRPDVECPSNCASAVANATSDAMGGAIDIYDIYEDVCQDPATSRVRTQEFTLMEERRRAVISHSLKHGRHLQTTISPIFPTCISNIAERYLNLPNVQKAIHIRPGTVPNGHWSQCGNVNYTFNYESELPNYKRWVAEDDLQILIYNGDADYILSHMGNANWINNGLKLKKFREWTAWHGSDKQVAGYFEEYATAGTQPFTFLTVKGAGHLVPKDRPRHALDMFSRFLSGGGYDKVKEEAEVPLCPT